MTIPLPPLPLPAPPRPQPAAATDEELCLLGATRLADYLDFVRSRAVDGHDFDQGELAQDWRDAAKVYEGLQTTEAGAADKPEVLPLPAELQAHVRQLSELPSMRNSFQQVPVAFGMVPLNQLVAYQQHITRSTVDAILAGLPETPTLQQLARLCLPLDVAHNGLRLIEQADGRVVLLADNHDARFLGARVLQARQVKGLEVAGHPQSVLALAIGGTTNILNVVRFGNRLVLNNGYHRAWALLQRGVTHAPCLIHVCSHWEDVGLAGASEMFHNGSVYFSLARPPLLRDFGNPDLTCSFDTWRTRKQVRVTFEVETSHVRS